MTKLFSTLVTFLGRGSEPSDELPENRTGVLVAYFAFASYTLTLLLVFTLSIK